MDHKSQFNLYGDRVQMAFKDIHNTLCLNEDTLSFFLNNDIVVGMLVQRNAGNFVRRRSSQDSALQHKTRCLM
jgi:hypothetical protein